MKRNQITTRKVFAVLITLSLMVVAFGGGMSLASSSAVAESNAPAVDPSPAIAVVQKTANSVVGISSYTQQWTRENGMTDTLYSQGSGVVIADGGYILTNYHVIEDCSSFKVLMPDGTYVKATVIGTDSSTDMAVLQVEERANELVAVTPGSVADLLVGSTVIAIGNPGGEVLANTTTQGIVSALERNVNANNTSRQIKYIQHDAPISSGNSGGGLFNVNGELVGINTLKYTGSYFDSVSFEGLGFAIPVDTAYPIAMDLIKYGEVQRPQLGITATSFTDGPEEATATYAPASVLIASVTEGGPAEQAGLQPYDFIIAIDGVSVTDMRELTTELDQHKDGDTVTLTIVRYDDPSLVYNLSGYFNNDVNQYRSGSIFGRYNGRSNGFGNTSSFETLQIDVTLKVPSKD